MIEKTALSWLYLAIAIVAEVIGTAALKETAGFTRLVPTAIVAVGYIAAFYFLSLTLETIPMGIAYAVWSGVGIILITLIGLMLFGQTLDAPAMIGMALILTGVIVIYVFSKSVAH